MPPHPGKTPENSRNGPVPQGSPGRGIGDGRNPDELQDMKARARKSNAPRVKGRAPKEAHGEPKHQEPAATLGTPGKQGLPEGVGGHRPPPHTHTGTPMRKKRKAVFL
jgi:hypothetical protein